MKTNAAEIFKQLLLVNISNSNKTSTIFMGHFKQALQRIINEIFNKTLTKQDATKFTNSVTILICITILYNKFALSFSLTEQRMLTIYCGELYTLVT